MISYSRLLWWKTEFELQLVCQRSAVSLDIGQGLVPVDMRLAPAEQIQVRAVQHEYESAHGVISSGAGLARSHPLMC
jgi:hypothetical protein